jgi:hypothetical protein
MYCRARYYAPAQARFISEDSYGFGGGDANFYAYVGGDPLSANDPSGHHPLLVLLWVVRIAQIGLFVHSVHQGYQLLTDACATRADKVAAIVAMATSAAGGALLGKAAGQILKGLLAAKKLVRLQAAFENLAEKYLLPKFRAVDPGLKAGFTGSFNTGVVGNPNKSRYGQGVDLNDFDIDYWIESDVLFSRMGNKLASDPKFRQVLSETAGFEGLRQGKKGFSIKFKPSSGE